MKPAYRNDIDGLRAIAVGSVVLFHAGCPGLSGGYTGVDIFFVISGYLIGGHIFQELQHNTFSFKRFYFRRAKRILPAFYVVLMATTVLSFLLHARAETVEFARSAIASIFSASNLYFFKTSGYFSGNSDFKPLLMTWSLGVEEQFYFIIPVIMVFLSRFKRSSSLQMFLLGISVLSFVFSCCALHRYTDFVFYMIPSRMWELGAGVLLAIAETRFASILGKLNSSHICTLFASLGMLLMLAPVVFYSQATPFPGLAALPTVAGTVILIASHRSFINERLLSLAPLTYIGKISYSLYLWHWPLLSFLRDISARSRVGYSAYFVIAIAILLSHITYKFVETPFRHTSTRPEKSLLRYALVSALLLLMSVAITQIDLSPVQAARSIQPALHQKTPCLVDYGASAPDASRYCDSSSSTNRQTIALWGDSHASALSPAIRDLAGKTGSGYVQLTKSSCLPVLDVAKYVPDHEAVIAECIQFNRRAFNRIVSDASIKYVYVSGRWGEPIAEPETHPLLALHDGYGKKNSAQEATVLSRALLHTLSELEGAHKHVVIISDIPNFDFDPPRAYYTFTIPARMLIAESMVPYNDILLHKGESKDSYAYANQIANNIISNSVKTESGMRFVNLDESLCSGDGYCQYASGNALLYEDSQHLTVSGAFYALRNMRWSQ